MHHDMKRTLNTLFFWVGFLSVLFWAFNTIDLSSPNSHSPSHRPVATSHGGRGQPVQTQVPVTPKADPAPATQVAEPVKRQELGPFGKWMLHWGLLILGVPLVFVTVMNYRRWRLQKEGKKASERAEKRAEAEAEALPINKLLGRRKPTKKQEPIEVEINGQKVKLPEMRCDTATLILPNDPRFAGLTFDKVIGQKEAKVEIEEILDMLQHPEFYAHMECKMPTGVLLHGTHGVGKTLLVRTLAALCGVPVLEIAGSEFNEMFVGVGSSRARLLYEDADELVKIYGACLIFIDEFDAVARARGGTNSSSGETETTLNQLLKEMDGIIPRPKVLTFAATNRKDILDPAAIRPGRFDRHIEFFNPNRQDRHDLIGVYLPSHLRAEGLDLHQAAKATPSASGAHMAGIVNEAKILAARARKRAVDQGTLDEAVQKVLYGLRRDSQRTVLTVDEIDTVRVHEGGHALVYYKITGKAPIRFTVIPRGASGGHVAYADDFEMLNTEEHLNMRLAVLMGGAASTFFERKGQKDTGISSDYKMANEIAIQMVAVYGMSPLGNINLEVLSKAGLVSDALKEQIRQAADALVEAGRKRAFEIVENNRDDLRKLIAEVDKHETLLEHDWARIYPKTQDNGGDHA